ncbi:JNK-interacting protein 3 [Paragonimus kellicotti]|nr:JNK-interacting protein 3 [Paragonimus kellicotti]
MLMKEVEYLRVNRDQTREEVNRLVRQLNEHQKQLAHVHTRLKLYEDVEDFCPADVSLKPSKQNCSLVHAASCSLINQEGTPDLTPLMRSQTPQVESGAYLGGSLKHAIPGGFTRSVSIAVGPDRSGNNQAAGQSIVSFSKDRKLSDPLISVKDPLSTGKLGEPCFTKREMARVIAERNYYKENLLELQDAVRYMEDMRARRNNYNDGVNPGGYTDQATRLSARNYHELGSFRQFFSNLQSVADDFATGLYELFTELEPIFTPSWPSEVYATDSGVSQRRRSAVFRTGSSELRRMFSHLLGHAAGQGTEAVFGTGNDFAAAVTSQSLTNSIPQLLGGDHSVSTTAADAISVNDGSRTHDLQHAISIRQPESTGATITVEGHRQSTKPICTSPAETVSAPT